MATIFKTYVMTILLLYMAKTVRGQDHTLPQIDLEELQSATSSTGDLQRLFKLKDQGGKLGAFVIKTNLDNTVKSFISKAPGCIGSMRESEHLPQVSMHDGSLRTTFATIESLDLSHNDSYPNCLEPEASMISDLFEVIDTEVVKVIEMFSGGHTLKYELHNQISNISDLPTKSHIHVYEKGILIGMPFLI